MYDCGSVARLGTWPASQAGHDHLAMRARWQCGCSSFEQRKLRRQRQEGGSTRPTRLRGVEGRGGDRVVLAEDGADEVDVEEGVAEVLGDGFADGVLQDEDVVGLNQ